jgi:hypothetical protein
MAKIIKVGSQSPTFTTVKAKKGSIKTQRNSNEVTNPFKFTNFEGNTLQFADVFEGFKPSFKSSPANKMRIIASSVTGSMSKVKSLVPESIVNFARRVVSDISDAANAIKENSVVKRTTEFLLAERHLPDFYNLSPRIASIRESISQGVEFMNRDVVEVGKDFTANVSAKCKEIISNINFSHRSRYANMSVSELEECFAAALAEGGIA